MNVCVCMCVSPCVCICVYLLKIISICHVQRTFLYACEYSSALDDTMYTSLTWDKDIKSRTYICITSPTPTMSLSIFPK